MNWKLHTHQSTNNNLKFGITENSYLITYERFLELLENSTDFIQFYNTLLINSEFKAFFWENPPITTKTLDQPYECNLIYSSFLAGTVPDRLTFNQYFRNDKQVVSFMNLGGDAELIVPCPAEDHSGFAHIGTFIRSAPKNQIKEFWEITARQMNNAIGKNPKWLSTSGMGVFWLHARIDSRPKYYQTPEYKQL